MHLWSCIWIFISRLFLWTLNTLKIYLAWHDFNLFGFQECWFKNHFIFMISLMNDRQKNPAENSVRYFDFWTTFKWIECKKVPFFKIPFVNYIYVLTYRWTKRIWHQSLALPHPVFPNGTRSGSPPRTLARAGLQSMENLNLNLLLQA